MDLFTAFGLSTSAGLNAYLPLLVVALAAKYTSLIQLNEPWDIMTSWWVIGVITVLLFVEMTVDKIPAIDTFNDVLQTFGRPVAGAVLFAASSGVVGELHPVLAMTAGLVFAGGIHAVKSIARPAVTATTGGTGNWAVSIIEDILALFGAILAILVPIFIAFVIVFSLLTLLWWHNRRRSKIVAT